MARVYDLLVLNTELSLAVASGRATAARIEIVDSPRRCFTYSDVERGNGLCRNIASAIWDPHRALMRLEIASDATRDDVAAALDGAWWLHRFGCPAVDSPPWSREGELFVAGVTRRLIDYREDLEMVAGLAQACTPDTFLAAGIGVVR